MTIERLSEMDLGIDKYSSYVVLRSPIAKSELLLDAVLEK